MSWYKKIKSQSQIPLGEYWITDIGQVLFADGDIGESGHSQHVLEVLLNNKNLSYEEILNLLEADYPLKDGSKDIYEYLKKKKCTNEESNIIMHGIKGDFGDQISQFAMKKWKWKRVLKNNIETWTLNNYDLEIIIRGLNEIAEDDEEGNSLWTIDVASTRKLFMNVPLNVLEKGPKALASYNNTMSVHPFSLPNDAQANTWYNMIKIANPLVDIPSGMDYDDIAHKGKEIYLYVIDKGSFVYTKSKSNGDNYFHMHENDPEWRYTEFNTFGRVDITNQTASIVQEFDYTEQMRKREERQIAVNGIYKNFGKNIKIYDFTR